MTSEQHQYQHIDPSTLLDIADNNIEVFLELSATFLEIAPPMFMRLQAAILCGNMAAVTLESHSLKSTVALVGAKATAALLGRVEALSRSAPIDDIKPMLADLSALCAATEAEVRESIVRGNAQAARTGKNQPE